MSYAYIKKYGRWKSDVALIYYRDEDMIASKVASAFNKVWAKHGNTMEYGRLGNVKAK